MRKIFLTAIAVLCVYGLNAQIKNGVEFIDFCKTEFGTKPKFLTDNKWTLFIPKQVSTDSDGTKTESYGYKKTYNGGLYKLGIERLTSSGTKTQVLKTTLILPNGNVFDSWIDNLENSGYAFNKVKGEEGKLYAGRTGLMITAEIQNIDQPSSSWIYVITVITDKRK